MILVVLSYRRWYTMMILVILSYLRFRYRNWIYKRVKSSFIVCPSCIECSYSVMFLRFVRLWALPHLDGASVPVVRLQLWNIITQVLFSEWDILTSGFGRFNAWI